MLDHQKAAAATADREEVCGCGVAGGDQLCDQLGGGECEGEDDVEDQGPGAEVRVSWAESGLGGGREDEGGAEAWEGEVGWEDGQEEVE